MTTKDERAAEAADAKAEKAASKSGYVWMRNPADGRPVRVMDYQIDDHIKRQFAPCAAPDGEK